jgi:hypothetical protein
MSSAACLVITTAQRAAMAQRAAKHQCSGSPAAAGSALRVAAFAGCCVSSEQAAVRSLFAVLFALTSLYML